ncbi:MAG: hypothetical protein Q7S87_03460 [Agitococcus sp.]|nr:hypothetical protein [Agitococcus sp.]MDO9178694.1 hypothetical protein [Agitococcus sp.]
MPKFIVTYTAISPSLGGAEGRHLPQAQRETVLPWLKASYPGLPGIDSTQDIVITGIRAINVHTRLNQDVPAFHVQLELEASAEYKVDLYEIPYAVLALCTQLLSRQAPSFEVVEPLTWATSYTQLVVVPHVITMKSDPKRRQMLEKEARYVLSVNGTEYGELYYNMRGYVGYIPLPNGHGLDIGEKGISVFKKEIAAINREAREALKRAASSGD